MRGGWFTHFMVAALVFMATTLYWRQEYIARQNAVLRDYWVLKTEHDKLLKDAATLRSDMHAEWLKIKESLSK